MPAPANLSLARFTPEQFNDYLRPQLRAFLQTHSAELAGHQVDEDQALADMYDLVHGRSTLDWGVTPRDIGPLPELENVTPACVTAVIGVAIGAVALVFQAAGVPSSVTRAVGTTVVSEALAASPALAVTLVDQVEALSTASSLWDQALAIKNLFGSINNVVSISAIVSAIKDELSWYQWILVGVTAAAQLTLWFTTGGTAAVAELVLFGTAIASLVISAQNASTVCSLPSTSALVGAGDDLTPAFVLIDVSMEPVAMTESGALYITSGDGTWVDTQMVVEDFSTTLGASGRLWTIEPNGGADGTIWYTDPSGPPVQTNGQASLISVADDGDAWAIQASSRAVLRWDSSAESWQATGDSLDQIAASSAALAWGIATDTTAGDETVLLKNINGSTGWQKEAGAPTDPNDPNAGTLDMIQIATNAAGDLVCVTADNRVFQYVAVDGEASSWVQLGGDDLAASAICIRDPQNAWLLDLSGQPQALGPILNPAANPGVLQWDTEDVWDETKSTHLFIVNRGATLLATIQGDAAAQAFVNQQIQPGVGQQQAGAFRQGLCQGLYDADFLSDYNNPNWIGQPTWESHFYDASTQENYRGDTVPTAFTNGMKFFSQAVATYQASDPSTFQPAGYALGLALHYFTDLTQPMHAANYTYLSSFPFGYHTDFEEFTMAVQANVFQMPAVPFVAGPANDPAVLFNSVAAASKSNYFQAVDQAHKYATWKILPATWQQAVLMLLPSILGDAVTATAQLLYIFVNQLAPVTAAKEPATV